MKFRQVHRAECSHCGHVERTCDSGSFIDRFFLPSMCENCGEHPDWLHVIEKRKFTPAQRTINPLTWLQTGRWETVGRLTMKA